MNLLLSGLIAAVAVVGTNSVETVESSSKTNRIAKITAESATYGQKDGVACFAGNVFVDDDEYQLHSDTAYVFMDKEGTNQLKRIVAVGNVALTNETRRAYGAKASYYRKEGMVVLYAPEGGYCEVRDEKEDPPQSVRGSKIKFWIGSEQIQVEKAVISAPVTGEGAKGLKTTIGGNK